MSCIIFSAFTTHLKLPKFVFSFMKKLLRDGWRLAPESVLKLILILELEINLIYKTVLKILELILESCTYGAFTNQWKALCQYQSIVRTSDDHCAVLYFTSLFSNCFNIFSCFLFQCVHGR